MLPKHLGVLAALAGSLALLPFPIRSALSEPDDSAVTIDDIATGIEKHIAESARTNGGYFSLSFNKKELRLQLVRVHLEYLAHLGRGVSFACVDLVGTDGPVYDVDFFMKGPPGDMVVTETSV